jgi:hypothetical protein
MWALSIQFLVELLLVSAVSDSADVVDHYQNWNSRRRPQHSSNEMTAHFL